MEGFDSKTEVLTRTGPGAFNWKYMKDLKPGDEVCTVDEHTFGVGFTSLQNVKRGIFTGKMFQVKDKFFNFRVTPGKKLFVGDCSSTWRKGPVTKWQTLTAQEVDNQSTRHLLSGWIKPPNPRLFSERLGRLIGILCFRTCFILGGKRLVVPVSTRREGQCIRELGYNFLEIENGYYSLEIKEDLDIIRNLVEDRRTIVLPGDLTRYSKEDLISILEGMAFNAQKAGRSKRNLKTKTGYFWVSLEGSLPLPLHQQLSILCIFNGMISRRARIVNPEILKVLKIANINIGVLSYYTGENKVINDWVDYDAMIYDLDFGTGIKLILTRREERTLITVGGE